jgi:rubrerythrin
MSQNVDVTAANRMREHLEKAGFSQETIAFMMGRFMSQVANRVMDELTAKLADVILSPDSIHAASEEERIEKLSKLFQERTGMSIEQLRSDVTQKMVEEYEKAGKST